MKIYQIRHATIVIESGDYKIVVDPYLAFKESMISLQLFRMVRFIKSNPMKALPNNTDILLSGVTHALITHNHFDHIDKDGIEFLKERNIIVKPGEKKTFLVDPSKLYGVNMVMVGLKKQWGSE